VTITTPVCWWYVIQLLEFIQPTCVQNLTTLGSVVPVIWLEPPKFLMGQMTWPRHVTRDSLSSADCDLHIQPLHQIWSVCDHQLRRCRRQRKMWKLRWFKVVRGHPRSTATWPFGRVHTTFYSNLTETSLPSFKRQLKTFLFAKSFPSLWIAFSYLYCVLEATLPSLCHVNQHVLLLLLRSYLVPFSRYCRLFSKNYRSHVKMTTPLSGTICHP